MNRYDWIFLAFRVFVKAYQIREVQNLVATMASSEMEGKAKRNAVIEQIFPALNGAKRFIVKALIELSLARLAEDDEKQ
jgi:hypothetical protein